MNDIVLSSLLNLFALIGSRNGVDKARSLEVISNYLKRVFGVRNQKSYINLYSDLRDFYDDAPGLDKEMIIDGICTNLQSAVSPDAEALMLLRLMEFCKMQTEDFTPEDEVFRHAADNFAIGSDLFGDFSDFIQGNPTDSVLVLPLGEGTLKTLFIKQYNTLLFSFSGNGKVSMNDIPVISGVYQVWQQSGVLKTKDCAPMYYSTVMAMYDKWQLKDAVELCGRDVEFRYSPTSDIGMHNLSFDIHSGQLVAVMGGSGVGKSTLLSLLNGSIKPQSGRITINGHDISEPEAKALIGFVPQDDFLIGELTVYQNLYYTAKLCFDSLPEEELDAKVMSVLTQLGLDQAKDLKVGTPINKYISGGQRKRLNIALELIREPAVLFLDEPTSGLSSSDTEMVLNLLKEQTGKGKLILVIIHQPSSDVYKLFDRLWLLDKGGYPIFDGNPIEAISYFKGIANYVDPDATACPVCGNVNPEVVLNIIDEKSMEGVARHSEKRKVSPQEWHEMYLESRGRMHEVERTSIPTTGQKRPGFLRQVAIFLKRNVLAKMTDMQYVLVTALEAPVLAAICAFLTHFTPDSGVYTLMDNKNFPSFLFMAVIVSVFLGMSGSAEEIIKDRAILKRERFLNLSYAGYIWSKMIYMAGICLVQTLLFTLVGNAIMGIHGMFGIWWLLLFVTAFLSSLIGLLLSQCLSSVVSIYITIPVLLIPQILLCGLVVHFEDLNPRSETGNVPVAADVIPSRWAYEALAVASYSMNGFDSMTYDVDREKFSDQYYANVYVYELQSQLETMRDEVMKGGDPAPSHMEVIRNGISRLVSMCGLDGYDGDWSYESLAAYLESVKSELNSRGNHLTLAADRILSDYARENSGVSLLELKRRCHNLQLENLVLDRNAGTTHAVAGTSIVPRMGHIYLTPVSRNGRAPFYSGVKRLGNVQIPTYWFNIGVLLLMCILLGTCLIFDFPGKKVRKERN